MNNTQNHEKFNTILDHPIFIQYIAIINAVFSFIPVLGWAFFIAGIFAVISGFQKKQFIIITIAIIILIIKLFISLNS